MHRVRPSSVLSTRSPTEGRLQTGALEHSARPDTSRSKCPARTLQLGIGLAKLYLRTSKPLPSRRGRRRSNRSQCLGGASLPVPGAKDTRSSLTDGPSRITPPAPSDRTPSSSRPSIERQRGLVTAASSVTRARCLVRASNPVRHMGNKRGGGRGGGGDSFAGYPPTCVHGALITASRRASGWNQ